MPKAHVVERFRESDPAELGMFSVVVDADEAEEVEACNGVAMTGVVVLCERMASDAVVVVVDVVAFLGLAEGASEFVWISWLFFFFHLVQEEVLDFVFFGEAEFDVVGRVRAVVVLVGWFRVGIEEILVVQRAEHDEVVSLSKSQWDNWRGHFGEGGVENERFVGLYGCLEAWMRVGAKVKVG